MSEVLSVFVLLVVSAFCSQRNIRYQSDTDFIDKICIPEFSSSTWNFTVTRSAIECSALCSKTPGCNGVFYNRSKGTCLGGSHVFNDATHCQVETGSVYFTIETIPYNAVCDGTVPCSGDNMVCWDGKCVCKPGYSLWSSWTACVEDCDEVSAGMGTSFQEYRGWRLDGFNTDYFSGLSLEDCQQHCVDRTEPQCTSVDTVASTGYCALNYATPLTGPQGFEANENQDYYFRNCQ